LVVERIIVEKIEIKAFKGKEGFYKIKEDWDRIVKNFANKKLGHIYDGHKAYIDALNEEECNFLYYVIIYRNNQPIAICPIVRTLKKVLGFNFKVLQIALPKVTEIGDFIYEKNEDNKEIINLFLKSLKKTIGYNWKWISLLVQEDSSIYFSVNSFLQKFPLVEKERSIYYFRSYSYENINKNISKNFRHVIKQARNRLLREKNIEILTVRDEKDIKKAYQDFVKIEGGGWKGKEGSSIKSDQYVKNFYENSIRCYCKEYKIEINFLKVNDIIISGLLCFLLDDTLYVAKTGYDEKHSYLRPGLILFDELLKRYSGHKCIKEINTCNDSEWVSNWKPLSMNVYRISIFNKTLGGQIYKIMFKCKHLKVNVYKEFLKKLKQISFLKNMPIYWKKNN
jgi:hypothetical protein